MGTGRAVAVIAIASVKGGVGKTTLAADLAWRRFRLWTEARLAQHADALASDAERLRANPLGIYVNAISWSREMAQ